MNEQLFRDLVSGKRRGVTAALWRAALRSAGGLYGLGVRLRNWGYDTGLLTTMHAGVPVVSIGNLTLGGTGKTPMVEHVVRWFQDRKVRVATLSRGYGAKRGELNDEALLLRANLPGVPHLADPDRIRIARQAVEAHQAQVLVLDDGFQHRRLARDLNLVLIDALAPFGYGRLFPGGMLREPLSSLARADVVVLSRADLCPPEHRAQIRCVVREIRPELPSIEVAHRPTHWQNSAGHRLPINALAGRAVTAFCGIGSPEGFHRTLERLGCHVTALESLPDHQPYDPPQVERLARWVAKQPGEAVVTTQKDLVKLGVETLGGRPLWALRIEVDVLAGRDVLDARLAQIAGQAALPGPHWPGKEGKAADRPSQLPEGNGWNR